MAHRQNCYPRLRHRLQYHSHWYHTQQVGNHRIFGPLPTIVQWYPGCCRHPLGCVRADHLCARGGKKGIHPGAHVGLHLIFWLVSAIAVVFEALFGVDSFYWPFATQEHVAFAFTCLLL
ncbi:hypothetical protein CGRA01v4_06107 [Colletotrichum graminicola]|nr:hypothetical protein CGRA01v4_06107 [Colletotrichum graminicola]